MHCGRMMQENLERGMNGKILYIVLDSSPCFCPDQMYEGACVSRGSMSPSFIALTASKSTHLCAFQFLKATLQNTGMDSDLGLPLRP